MVAAAVVAASAAYSAYSTNQSAQQARGQLGAGERAGRQDISKSYGQAPMFVQAGAQRASTDLNKGNLAAQAQYLPFTKAGGLAETKLETLLGLRGGKGAALRALQNTPGYQFALQQGDQATINAASAGGFGVNSGNTLEALSQYNQGLATQTYQNQVNDLMGLTGQGLTAASLAGGADLSTAGALANVQMGAGDTLANLYSQKGTSLGNIDIGAATNAANISAAQGASNAANVNNTMSDFLLLNMMNQGGAVGGGTGSSMGGAMDYYNSDISRWDYVRH